MKFFYETEIYYRATQKFQQDYKKLAENRKKDGSTLPVVARNFEEIKTPRLWTATQCRDFFIGILIVSYENDYAISKIANHFFGLARKYNFEGKWNFWKDYIQEYNIQPEGSMKKQLGEIDTAFDLPSFFDWLVRTQMSEDDLFGNVIKNSARLILNCYRIRPIPTEPPKIKVVRPQRKRGYDDKGSLASFDSHARKLANMEKSDERQKINADFTYEVSIWGHPKHRKK